MKAIHAKHADIDGQNDLSERMIGGAFTALDPLEAGFLERANEHALTLDVRTGIVSLVRQRGATVHHNGVVGGG